MWRVAKNGAEPELAKLSACITEPVSGPNIAVMPQMGKEKHALLGPRTPECNHVAANDIAPHSQQASPSCQS